MTMSPRTFRIDSISNLRSRTLGRASKLVIRTALPVGLAICTSLAGCSGGGSEHKGGDGDGDDTDASVDGSISGDGDGDNGQSDAQVLNQMLVLTPSSPIHTIGVDGLPTLAFAAMLTPVRGAMSTVRWSSDHPELGSIDANGIFTPSGAAGSVTVTATVGAFTASTKLTLVINATAEGDPTPLEGGAGGAGGVGGEGGGTMITDPTLRAALDAAPTTDAELQWLYPYDGTVWPRGLPAPLLQWRNGTHAPLAVKIRIEVGPDFVYQGYFGPPTALPAATPISHLPIPRQVWRNALYSGTEMKVSLVVAASDGAGGYAAFAPAAGLNWKIAPGSLKGTVYYNTYGSKLAEQKGDDWSGFGGATLAIRGSSLSPELVAGSTTDDESGCRVCHTVSGNGAVMIAQQADNKISSRYSLTNNNLEAVYADGNEGKFGWAALSPDGTVALGNAGPPGSNEDNQASLGSSGLYRVSDGLVLTAEGLSQFVTKAATPVFSTAGNRVAFNFFEGPGTLADVTAERSLVMMDFTKVDDMKYTFGNPVKLFTATEGTERPSWPFFLPDDSGVIFELEKAHSTTKGELFVTRTGARGELWWTDLTGNAHRLDRLNGLGYLPTGPNNHDNDVTLQYEPTVAPIVAGGYAWVVFTSRRLYGDIATRDPYESDPRTKDLTPGNTTGGPTTKKLWVAAIDMPPKPGTDPSHPAFYLPAQELFAGNSRAFWVPDACQENGKTCVSGDECCGGYCRANADGVPVCMDELPPASCAMEYENCATDQDCCVVPESPLTCINNRCAQSTILF